MGPYLNLAKVGFPFSTMYRLGPRLPRVWFYRIGCSLRTGLSGPMFLKNHSFMMTKSAGSARSCQVYISFATTSVSSPTPRAKSSVASKIGVSNLVKVVRAEYITHRRLDKIPQRRLRRQKVARSSNRFNHGIASSYWLLASSSHSPTTCHPERSRFIRLRMNHGESRVST